MNEMSLPAAAKAPATAEPAASNDGFDFDKAIQPDRERPDAQPGALLRATVDTDHWLSAGQDGEAQVVIEGSRVFAPVKLSAHFHLCGTPENNGGRIKIRIH